VVFLESKMRAFMLLNVAIGLGFVAGFGSSAPAFAHQSKTHRIASLIQQLGDAEFSKREAASKELDTIGTAALEALRKAASGDNPEIRRRAGRLVQAIAGRMHAAAAKTELPRWQGEWAGKDGQKMVIRKDQWASSTGSGTLKHIEIREGFTQVDLVVEDGSKTKTCKMILHLDGDTLHSCGSYEATRPTEFKESANNIYIAWKRVEAQAAYDRYHGDSISTGLPLPESKEPVHRVSLRCWVTNGGPGVLTVDPNGPRFNDFGDPVASGNPLPLVALDCTLRLLKKEKERQLYEVSGPKITSRLTLAAFPLDSPSGDARLLVHDKGGEVRYVLSLTEGSHRTPPCHPGCFPAGTLVRVPAGTRPIERIREGDLVATIDADGKTVSAQVRGVFATRNRVLALRVEGGQLVTTATQPIALAGGDFRPAAGLKAGDRVWRWVAGKRQAVKVLGVSPADREVEVFNLVLGNPKAFIAGDFLVRSKPPPVEVRPVPNRIEAVPRP
jgi:hypothetical protein